MQFTFQSMRDGSTLEELQLLSINKALVDNNNNREFLLYGTLFMHEQHLDLWVLGPCSTQLKHTPSCSTLILTAYWKVALNNQTASNTALFLHWILTEHGLRFVCGHKWTNLPCQFVCAHWCWTNQDPAMGNTWIRMDVNGSPSAQFRSTPTRREGVSGTQIMADLHLDT